jgi:hypothetical protein
MVPNNVFEGILFIWQTGDYPQGNVGKWKSSLGRFTWELDMKHKFLIIFQYPSILSFSLLIRIKLVFFLFFFPHFL